MAEEVAQATDVTAKLILDDVTGELVSKNELKKRAQKRTKKGSPRPRAKEVAQNLGKGVDAPVPNVTGKRDTTEEIPIIRT